MSKVELYTKGHCPYCQEFQEYPIDVQPELRDTMIERANGGWTVPQIFINDEHVGGCDDLMALEAQNKLNPMLGLA